MEKEDHDDRWIEESRDQQKTEEGDERIEAENEGNLRRVFEAKVEDFWNELTGVLGNAVEKYNMDLDSEKRIYFERDPDTFTAQNPVRPGATVRGDLDKGGERFVCRYTVGDVPSFDREYSLKVHGTALKIYARGHVRPVPIARLARPILRPIS